MCTQITNALQRRSRAVKNAVEKYNKAATNLNPPKPAIEWSCVTQYEFIQDFTLLRDCNPDLITKPWVNPLVRLMMKQHHRVQRAHEEIKRLNVEVRRLHTSIVDEGRFLDDRLSEARESHSKPFCYVLEEFISRRSAANAHIMHKLDKLYHTPGFTGIATPGKRVEGNNTAFPGLDSSSGIARDAYQALDVQSELGEESEEEDDDRAQELDGVLEYITSMSLDPHV